MQNTEIIIVGAGPTGLVLANLLAQSGLKIKIIEKQKNVYPVPRATHIDEETLRNFQMTGLMSELEPHTCPFGMVDMTDNKGNILFTEQVSQPATEHLYMGSRFFDQPAFESILRKNLGNFPNVDLIVGEEVQKIEELENEIKVFSKNLDGKENTYTANYLIGSDGGRSLVRTSLNINMDSLEPARDWVIVDSLLKNESDAKLLPNNFRYIFENERLSIFAYGIGINNRWEFQLNIDEPMPAEEVVKSWVAKYISLDKIEITRIAKYAHNSLVAQKWRNKRIFLAGDSAHMMPPSAGQGLCSGVRDAVNLAWKISAIIKKNAKESVLDTYEEERKAHLHEILKRTLFFGSRLQGDNALQRFWRKIQIQTIELVKPLKDFLKATYNTPPILKNGFLSTKSDLAGHHFPQYAIKNKFSDDLIGYRFAFISLPNALKKEEIEVLKNKKMVYINELFDISESKYLEYLKKNHVDFALIRPDKIIFSTGKINDFGAILEELHKFLL